MSRENRKKFDFCGENLIDTGRGRAYSGLKAMSKLFDAAEKQFANGI